MPDYRAYLIGSDGHFYRSIALDAQDDAAAIAAAKQLVDGHDVEVWQRDRKIGSFKQEKKF
jgi:hypothetical protein